MAENSYERVLISDQNAVIKLNEYVDQLIEDKLQKVFELGIETGFQETIQDIKMKMEAAKIDTDEILFDVLLKNKLVEIKKTSLKDLEQRENSIEVEVKKEVSPNDFPFKEQFQELQLIGYKKGIEDLCNKLAKEGFSEENIKEITTEI